MCIVTYWGQMSFLYLFLISALKSYKSWTIFFLEKFFTMLKKLVCLMTFSYCRKNRQ